MIPITPITSTASAVTSIFGPVSATSGGSDTGFSSVLKSALNQVSSTQNEAGAQINSLLAGGNADMGKTMISVEKADVAFQLMLQVRNKIVNAYQDIEKLQF